MFITVSKQHVKFFQIKFWTSIRKFQVKMNTKPLVLCGPSGCGKSTLLKRLIQDFPDQLVYSVSHTTRQPRTGEKDGIHYHFVDVGKMQKEIESGSFIETATYNGNMYGTSKTAIESICQHGKVCVLDIDIQGVQQMKTTFQQPWCVFIKPPSIESLKDRLLLRKSETEQSLEQRLQIAKTEIAFGETPGNFDIVIVNDTVEDAYTELKVFVQTQVLENAKGGNEL